MTIKKNLADLKTAVAEKEAEASSKVKTPAKMLRKRLLPNII